MDSLIDKIIPIIYFLYLQDLKLMSYLHWYCLMQRSHHQWDDPTGPRNNNSGGPHVFLWCYIPVKTGYVISICINDSIQRRCDKSCQLSRDKELFEFLAPRFGIIEERSQIIAEKMTLAPFRGVEGTSTLCWGCDFGSHLVGASFVQTGWSWKRKMRSGMWGSMEGVAKETWILFFFSPISITSIQKSNES